MGGSAVRTGGYPSSGRRGANRFPAGHGWGGLGECVRARESGPQSAFEVPGTVAAAPPSLGRLPEIEMRALRCDVQFFVADGALGARLRRC